MELFTKTIKLAPIVYKNPDIKNRTKKYSSSYSLVTKAELMRDSRISTLDLETFFDTLANGEIYVRVYALGFANENLTKLYYLTDHFDSAIANKLVLKCIEDKFYNKNINLSLYKSNYKTIWILREEMLKYLEKDLTFLFELIVKFQEILRKDHNIELKKVLL